MSGTVATNMPTLSTKQYDVVINGRFLTQKTTGVQRYAREITGAIDDILHEEGRTGKIIVPTSDHPLPQFKALTVLPAGPGEGYVWEQITLPLRYREPVLNFCNTAPVIRSDQIVCIHDANIHRMPQSFSFLFRNTYRMLHPLLARRGMKVTTVSRYAADELAETLPVSRSDISIMPNGHEHALRWNVAASTIFDRFPTARPFILLLGNRAQHKNAKLILGLAADLDQMGIDLVVAGSSAGIFAATHAISAANIKPVGFVSDDDLAALFANALCLTFPSITEGFGLPIVEAMALGCPVISSDSSCMPEICGDAALLASPHDPEMWLKHIAALQSSPELREQLIARGRIQARSFSWRNSARGYLDLLQFGTKDVVSTVNAA
jgi:glycosyltransferase involved in cell wall biosynthesis